MISLACRVRAEIRKAPIKPSAIARRPTDLKAGGGVLDVLAEFDSLFGTNRERQTTVSTIYDRERERERGSLARGNPGVERNLQISAVISESESGISSGKFALDYEHYSHAR